MWFIRRVWPRSRFGCAPRGEDGEDCAVQVGPMAKHRRIGAAAWIVACCNVGSLHVLKNCRRVRSSPTWVGLRSDAHVGSDAGRRPAEISLAVFCGDPLPSGLGKRRRWSLAAIRSGLSCGRCWACARSRRRGWWGDRLDRKVASGKPVAETSGQPIIPSLVDSGSCSIRMGIAREVKERLATGMAAIGCGARNRLRRGFRAF